MNGKIWVESTVGRGSTFYFVARFNVAGVEDQKLAPADESAVSDGTPDESRRSTALQAGQRLRILLAEDNPTNQAYAVRTLEKQGYFVVVAGNGQEAIDAWQREDFDLALMDLQMPGVDGFQATETIRRGEAASGRHTPIIALTAHADREQCLSAGMDGFVSKPIRAKMLFAEIERLLSVRPPQLPSSVVPPSPPAVETIPDSVPVFDQAELLERVNNDPQFLAELIDLFKADYVALIGTLRDGLSKGDATSMARAAHTFKGMVGNFCAVPAMEAAKELEDMVQEGRVHEAAGGLARLEVEAERLETALESFAEGLCDARVDR
jgi:CheY-like chemotaxis protein/HPt (histidine-containing phosphotransfer) domain-containing protein